MLQRKCIIVRIFYSAIIAHVKQVVEGAYAAVVFAEFASRATRDGLILITKIAYKRALFAAQKICDVNV